MCYEWVMKENKVILWVEIQGNNYGGIIIKSLQKSAYPYKLELFIKRTVDQALKFIKNNFPDLVFIDLDLLDDTGVEVLKEVKKTGSVCPVIILADKDRRNDAVRAVCSGAVDYLIKTEAVLCDIPHIIDYYLNYQEVLGGFEKNKVEYIRCLSDKAERKKDKKITSAVNQELEKRGNERISEYIKTNRYLEAEINYRKIEEKKLLELINKLEKLIEVKNRILAVKDTDIFFEKVVDIIKESFGYYHVGIYMLDNDTGLFRLKAQSGMCTQIFQGDYNLDTAKGIPGWVADNKKSLLVNHVRMDSGYLSTFNENSDALSELSVPVIRDSDVIGVLDLQSTAVADFDQNDVRLIENVASQIALTVNKHLFCESIESKWSKQKQIEKELQGSESQYFNIIDNVNIGVYRNTGGNQGRFLKANTALAKMFGYESVEEFIAVPVAHLYHDPAERLEFVESARNEGFIKDSKIKLRKKDGSLIWVSCTAKVQYDDKGQIKWMDGVMEDISEIKVAEASLLESEELFRSVVENSYDGIFIVNAGCKIIYVNNELCNILGRDKESLSGNDFRDYITDEYKEIVFNKYIKHNKKLNVSARFEFDIFRESGVIRRVEISSSLIKESSGQIRTIAQVKDITEKKNMEEELKKYAEQLEQKVKQRTNELIQADKMVSLGYLVAGVAHEVNNPLAYIKLNTCFIMEDLNKLKEYCKENNISIDVFRDLEKILNTNIDGINKIDAITKSLKRFSRAGLECKEEADINQGIRDTLIIVRNQFRHSIEVIEEYGDIPLIKCNIGQLNQVFMNLIINSSQSMERGSIQVVTWIDNDNLFISFTDNGCGIEKDKLTNIFDPFFTTREEGTGLGLSLSYKIIKDHDGDITADSTPGKGTTMTIRLPLNQK